MCLDVIKLFNGVKNNVTEFLCVAQDDLEFAISCSSLKVRGFQACVIVPIER